MADTALNDVELTMVNIEEKWDQKENGVNKVEETVANECVIRVEESEAKGGTCKVCGESYTGETFIVGHCQNCSKRYNISIENKNMMAKSRHNTVCGYCHKTFKTPGILKVHIRIHTGEKPYKCTECDRAFAQLCSLQAHSKSHANGGTQMRGRGRRRSAYQNETGPFNCAHCESTFTSYSFLKNHMRKHTGEKPFKCPYCDRRFTQNGNLKSHVRLHTGEKPFQCKVCERAFTHQSTLKAHLMSHTGEKPFKCKQCPRAFAQVGNLKTHMRTHTGEKPYSCDQCGKSFSQFCGLQWHLKRHAEEAENKPVITDENIPAVVADEKKIVTEKVYKCKHCDFVANRMGVFREHIKSHGLNKPYSCDICNKRFRMPSNLKIHMRKHTGEKPYECNYCHRMFSHSTSLRSHMLTHTGEKPYKCHICGRAFSQSGNLKAHVRLHTGERPYSCSQCNMAFAQLSGLQMHKKRCLSVAAEGNSENVVKDRKPLKCTLCDYITLRRRCLKAHMKMHTGERDFNCTLCGKQFTQASNLQIHMRKHTGEKPYGCGYCERTFAQKSTLKNHLKLHTGERPYECQRCGKGFIQNGNLKSHLKTCTSSKLHVEDVSSFVCRSCDKQFMNRIAYREHMKMHQVFRCECGKTFMKMGHFVNHKRSHCTAQLPPGHYLPSNAYLHPPEQFPQSNDPPQNAPQEMPQNGPREMPQNTSHDMPQNAPRKMPPHINHTPPSPPPLRQVYEHVEKPHVCRFCERTFAYMTSLINHERTHTGERPFLCEICGKGFIQKGNLQTHMKSHTGGHPPGEQHKVNRRRSRMHHSMIDPIAESMQRRMVRDDNGLPPEARIISKHPENIWTSEFHNSELAMNGFSSSELGMPKANDEFSPTSELSMTNGFSHSDLSFQNEFTQIKPVTSNEHSPDNRDKYSPDNRGKYYPDNRGKSSPDNRGKYVHVPDDGVYPPTVKEEELAKKDSNSSELKVEENAEVRMWTAGEDVASVNGENVVLVQQEESKMVVKEECKVCMEPFEGSLEVHMQGHYSCFHCDSVFVQQNELKTHIFKTHQVWWRKKA